jgi:hypothetical protein
MVPGRVFINTVQRNLKKCTSCKKRGHVVAECWKKQRKKHPPILILGLLKSAGPANLPSGLTVYFARCFLVSRRHSKPEGRLAGPADFKRPRINMVRARVTTLYTHAPQPRWILDRCVGIKGRHPRPHHIDPRSLEVGWPCQSSLWLNGKIYR